jgi:hypothetical protein
MCQDARVIAFEEPEGTIHVWDAVQDRKIQQIEAGKSITPGFGIVMALSPDGTLLVMTRFHSSVVELWETTKGKRLRELTSRGTQMGGFEFSPDGYTVAGHDRHTIWMWETASGAVRKQLRRKGDRAGSLAFSPDGLTLAAGKWGSGVSYAVDRTGSYRYTILYHTKAPSQVDLWDIRNGVVHATFHGHFEDVLQLAFSGDGKKLVSLGWEGAALVWQVPQRARPAPVDLTTKQLEDLWAKLAGDDCPAAYAAHWELAASPGPTVAFLKERLKPLPNADPKQVAEFRAALDSAKFAVRQKATSDLVKMGPLAEPLLRRMLEGNPTLELRRRVEALLAPLDDPVRGKERLRTVRALEVLERIGSSEARDLLQSLAEGAPGAWLTRQAQAAVKRLTVKSTRR